MNNSGKTITLYIPAYNAANTLEKCLNGVNVMTHQPDELLVIDDGSTDETAAIAERLGARVIHHPENRGIAAARNTALKEASHDLIAHLDADVAPSPEWLLKLLDGLDDDISGVGGKLIEKYQDGLFNRWRTVQMPQHWGNSMVENPTFLHGAAALYRKSALEAVGGYDERCRTNFEDNDMGLRLTENGYRLLYTPDAVAYHLRRDTLSSILMTNWRWTRRPRDTTSLNYKVRKVLINFWTLGRKIPRDIKQRSLAMMGLSLLVTVNNCIMDIRFFLTGREDPWWKTRRK